MLDSVGIAFGGVAALSLAAGLWASSTEPATSTFEGKMLESTALASPSDTPSSPAPRVERATIAWDARAAEHLLNRAGFGGPTAEVERLVALGHAAAVESFFPDPSRAPAPRILSQRSLHGGLESPQERHASMLARRSGYLAMQPDLIVPLDTFGDWWVERMIRAEDPLREHMTLFWHGHFVSSVKEVASSSEMIEQIRFLRDNALGSFETLARGIGRTPAMLEYLDNAENVKAHPNENWSRELMELFALGDGHYSEKDIKEASRAFTGWSDENARFVFRRLEHDFGQKHVLGVTGNFDGDQIVDLVLAQPACAEFVARKLLAFFEGTQPTETRVAEYAAALRASNWDVGALLRRLFLDPDFYRDEVVGTRVAGPIEYLIGSARRLEVDVPGAVILQAGDVLGQRVFWPPSVKGWEQGLAWITTATLMHRSNMIGVMLGIVDVRGLLVDHEFERAPDAMGGMQPAAKERASRTVGFTGLAHVQTCNWTPRLALAARLEREGVRTDDELVDALLADLLAVSVDAALLDEDLRAKPLALLAQRKRELGIAPGTPLVADPARAEAVVRELAHLILSSEEAQLH